MDPEFGLQNASEFECKYASFLPCKFIILDTVIATGVFCNTQRIQKRKPQAIKDKQVHM
jgi:hypothetical protein